MQCQTIFLHLILLAFLDISKLPFCCKIEKCNMVQNRAPAVFRQLEATLLEEIADLSEKIRDLMLQKNSAERLLFKARQQSDLVRRSDVTRKNSVNRILVEGSIIQSIEKAN